MKKQKIEFFSKFFLLVMVGGSLPCSWDWEYVEQHSVPAYIITDG